MGEGEKEKYSLHVGRDLSEELGVCDLNDARTKVRLNPKVTRLGLLNDHVTQTVAEEDSAMSVIDQRTAEVETVTVKVSGTTFAWRRRGQ